MTNPLSSMFRSTTLRVKLAALALQALAALLPAQAQRAPTLPAGSEFLQAPAGNVVSLHAYAQGVQVYRYDAVPGQWTLAYPFAHLYADAGCLALIGLHTGGPTWMTFSGSTVAGQALAASTVDPNSIPWLLIGAVSSEGPGVLASTTFVQRVNTNGGRPPARVGMPGEIVLIPYTAEYYFYRGQ